MYCFNRNPRKWLLTTNIASHIENWAIYHWAFWKKCVVMAPNWSHFPGCTAIGFRVPPKLNEMSAANISSNASHTAHQSSVLQRADQPLSPLILLWLNNNILLSYLLIQVIESLIIFLSFLILSYFLLKINTSNIFLVILYKEYQKHLTYIKILT